MRLGKGLHILQVDDFDCNLSAALPVQPASLQASSTQSKHFGACIRQRALSSTGARDKHASGSKFAGNLWP